MVEDSIPPEFRTTPAPEKNRPFLEPKRIPLRPVVVGVVVAVLLGIVLTLQVRAWGSLSETGGSCGSYRPCPQGTAPILVVSFLALFVLIPATVVVVSRRLAIGGRVGQLAAVATLAASLIGVIPGNAIWTWAHGSAPSTLSIEWQLARQNGGSGLKAQGSWILGGTVIRAQLDQVAAYDIDDGSAKWTYEVPGMGLLCAMSRDIAGTIGVIAYGQDSSSCDSMVALDLLTGRELWHQGLSGNGLPSSPKSDFIAVAGDLAFVATPDPADKNGFQAFDIHTGAPRWHVGLPDMCQPESLGGDLTVEVRCLHFDVNNPRASTQFSYDVHSYDPATGAQRWDTAIPFRGSNATLTVLSYAPLAVDVRETDTRGRDQVLGLSDGGQVQGRIDVTGSGLNLFSNGFGGQGNFPLVVADGMLIARASPTGSGNISLVAYRLADGTKAWSTSLNHNSFQAIARDGTRVVTITDRSFRETVTGYDLKTGAAQRLGSSGLDFLTATMELHVVDGAYVIVNESGSSYPSLAVMR